MGVTLLVVTPSKREAERQDRMRVAVDIGGTFTDAVAVDTDGTMRTAKAPSTPGHLHDGVLAALEQLELDWESVETITHGTTAGLNAFLERRGAKVALLTTQGFRDVYELGRANRPDMYNVRYRPPTPLVPRRSMRQRPVTVHRRVPVEATIERGRQIPRRQNILVTRQGVCDLVGIFLVDAFQS